MGYKCMVIIEPIRTPNVRRGPHEDTLDIERWKIRVSGCIIME